MKTSSRYWQQYDGTIRGPRTFSASSKPLSRCEIKVHSSEDMSSIALPSCRRKYFHEDRFSLSTKPQARTTFWPAASIPTAIRSVWTRRPNRAVPFTATRRRHDTKVARDCAGQRTSGRSYLAVFQLESAIIGCRRRETITCGRINRQIHHCTSSLQLDRVSIDW